MYRVLILLTALLVNAGIHAVKIQIDKPEWPLNYKVVFILFSKLNLIMNYSLTNDKVARSYKIISYRHVYVTRPTENSLLSDGMSTQKDSACALIATEYQRVCAERN